MPEKSSIYCHDQNTVRQPNISKIIRCNSVLRETECTITQSWIYKETKNMRAWPWTCAENNGISDTHTLTQEHTHMPFSTFQNTYYITWLSWTLTQGNVTEKINSELMFVTAHCPVFVSDFEDTMFDLLQHMINGHVLQLHHTFVVCCLHKRPSFRIGCHSGYFAWNYMHRKSIL